MKCFLMKVESWVLKPFIDDIRTDIRIHDMTSIRVTTTVNNLKHHVTQIVCIQIVD